MSHVEVHAPRVGEKPSIARRFIVSTMVQIEDASPLNMKEMIPNFVGKPGGGMIGPVLIHQEPVFGFKSENTVQHLNQPRQIEALSGEAVTGPPA